MDWEMEVAAEGMCRMDNQFEVDLDEQKSSESDRKTGGEGEEGVVTKVDLPGLSKAGTRWGILEVTRDLERLVADEEMREQMMMDEAMDMALDENGDGDVVMGDASVNTTPSALSPAPPAPRLLSNPPPQLHPSLPLYLPRRPLTPEPDTPHPHHASASPSNALHPWPSCLR
ncbi:hypothetical protein NLJ89_g11243 [Agrocybe chaxingu]|uniref:Uncharacterized protein n=1 Tax=Agrocybe chaxingu TaxID=84603 RepID=A0A9W8JX53_9AGAR|nr:hypothetical protein NLJ89_g11243 [Agrocybe chaxingu]